MDHINKNEDPVLEILKERAKELNCLYQVEEVLSNRQLSMPEIFEEIVRIIPSGWQFPDICQARIVYENSSYQLPNFIPSPWMDSSDIKVDDKIVGRVEVSYTKKVPWREGSFFLDKEHQLIRTIADRIGQVILHRRMESILREWDRARVELSEQQDRYQEWRVIISLLRRTDRSMLFHICQKMINHLSWSGITEANEILQKFDADPGEPVSGTRADQNSPSLKIPLDLQNICERTFRLAAERLSDKEITAYLKQWIFEEKGYQLIRAINRIGASLSEINEAVAEYCTNTEGTNTSYSPTERWLKVALIKRFLADDLSFINIAKQYIEVKDFRDVIQRVIFPAGSHGKLGGKSAGMLLARHILESFKEYLPMPFPIKTPKTWYITTDALTEFIHYNNLEELYELKYKNIQEIRANYPNIIQLMKNSRFPPGIIKSLAMALDDFGDTPLIVRSSSLLEDRIGASFSGKYKSLFLANQGSKQKRLEQLMDAIAEVYASVYGPDSLQYRSERGFLDFHEEMGIMIQELVGVRIGPYYLPLCAGVAFSNNELRWSPRVKREDGLVRMVMGFGTRAVDRLSDDFPVLVSPGQPALRVNFTPDEIKRYSPKKIDLINLEKETFETVDAKLFLQEYGDQIPNIHLLVSVFREDHLTQPSRFELDFAKDELIVNFEGLFSRTPFLKQMESILKTLAEKMKTPVDLEFAFDGENLFLLQCRSQSSGENNQPAPIPKDIPTNEIIFTAKRYISNGRIPGVSYIVYVSPEEYSQLTKLEDLQRVGRAVSMLNMLLPKRQFILMGPGRWGSRGNIKLGVQVGYADINNTCLLVEIAKQKGNYVPELSFGTHFFQDLVESDIRYLPLYPDDREILFNEAFLTRSENLLAKLLPEYGDLSDVIRVIDVPTVTHGKVLRVLMNGDLNEAIGYLTDPTVTIVEEKQTHEEPVPQPSDDFWRWRYHMAERIAAELDPNYFGVKAMYLFGSTANATAGPGSDIDLLIHCQGDEKQRQELLQWLDGWSLCLAEINFLKTGYSCKGLLDVHLISDEDIANKTSFAVKIGAVTDPAQPLKLKS
ncbi:MAG TPA: PEP/pyruvate-binding domain-containing protein [Bacillota bacterium]|nr:PEP/pyruvate-binding domain-containing protein [Bacillota bacterium]HPT68078.1 PEP/pyruvate-binding domain-containing protein [Bacillota bacterium]